MEVASLIDPLSPILGQVNRRRDLEQRSAVSRNRAPFVRALIVDKTRCSYYAQKALSRPGEKEFAPFVEWLAGA